MVATSIKDFIVSRLQEYFPELEVTEGSDLYAEVVQPILDRLGEDLFDTDIESFVTQRIRDEFPDLDIDTAGSVAKDVFVNPVILLFQAIKRELVAIREAKSLNQTSTLSTEELDSLLANVFVVRRPGVHSAGYARVYYASPTTIQADPTISFSASNGQTFVVNGSVDITSTKMASQVESGLYYADLSVISVLEDEEANIEAGLLLGATGLPGYVKVNNPEDFTGGITQETNSALLQRAGDIITERSLVTQRGVRTTLLQEYPELKGVSVIGTGDAEMTRDIIRGSTELSGLGYGPTYAAGMYGYFSLSATWDVWPLQRFPINNVFNNLAPLAVIPTTPANAVYADWYTEQPGVGDQLTVLGNNFDVTAVSSTFPTASLELECTLLASSSTYGLGGTTAEYMPSPISGGVLTCAPMFFTNTFGLTTTLSTAILQSLDPATDWLLVQDINYSVGLGGAGTGKYYRTKYFPIQEAGNATGNTLIKVLSQNAHYTPKEVQWVAWGAPDVATPGFETGASTGTNRGIGLSFEGPLGPDRLILTPALDLDFDAEGVSPGDIITLFGVDPTVTTQVVAWFEVVVQEYSGTDLICYQDRDWLYLQVTSMFPTFITAGGPFDTAGKLAFTRFFWTARSGNGSGTAALDSTYCWPTSFMPAWELPGAAGTYTWDPFWIPGGGAVELHRQFGEEFPELRGTIDTPAVGTQLPTYEPWVLAPWAILRVPSDKLPAIGTEWAAAGNTPPYGYETVSSATALGTDVSYPIRFYGSWFTWGLADCGDPIHETGGGVLSYRTDDLSALLLALPFAIEPYLCQWDLRKLTTAEDSSLSIVLSQLPEYADEVEIPPDEIHIGGMMDVYCNPASMPRTSLSLAPWVSFEDNDVVLPASFTGVSAVGGQAAAYLAQDGVFTSAALSDYSWEYGDLLVITGPSGDDYYHTSYAIIDQDRYYTTNLRVYPPFPDGAAHTGLEFVILRGVTTDLTPSKLYKVRNGEDLKTNIGSATVSSALSNFVTNGVANGDTLYIKEGKDKGYHIIASFTNTTLTLSEVLGGGETTVDFDVFTSGGSVSMPLINVEQVEGISSEGAAVAALLPYGAPVGALVRAAAMAGNALVSPAEGYESATAFTSVTAPADYTRVYSNAVDFALIGVLRGHRFAFTSGLYTGQSFTVAEVSTTGLPGAYVELRGFLVTEAETALTFTIGAPTQGTSRCYFKEPLRAEFNGVTRISVGTAKVYMPDPATHATLFTEASGDTDLQLELQTPIPTGVDGAVAGAGVAFTVSGTPFDDSIIGKYLHITAPAGPLVGTYLVATVTGPSSLTVAGGAPFAAAGAGLEWSIQPTTSSWTVLTSALAVNDWAVRGIKENTLQDMSYRSDSDRVYIDHQDIVSSTFLATPVTGLANKTLVFNINGSDSTYTFTMNSIARSSLPRYIEAAFPELEARILESGGNYFLHIFSSSDVIVGAGTANTFLKLTATDTTVVASALRGPFELGWNGVGVENGAPPIDSTNKAYIRLVEVNTDVPIAGYATLAGKLLHARIIRRGTQIFEAADMTAYGNYYYVDLDISSYYPGPTQILTEQTASTTVTNVVTNGFTYVADENHSYSIIEDVKVHTNGAYFATEYPTPVLGTNARFTYTYAPEVEVAHYYMQNKNARTVTCNTLAKVSVPLEISVRLTYKGSASVESAKNIIVDYLRTLAHGTLFTVRGFTSALRAQGLLVQSTPELLVIAPDANRQYTLYKVTEEYQMPDNGAFLLVSTVLTKG
jgi:hypothetical protein